MAAKGKEIAGKSSTTKRKREDKEKSGGRKKKNSGVLQFFDVTADVEEDEDEDGSDNDDFDEDFLDEVDRELKDKKELGKAHHLPFFLKEEELSDEELERLLEERYRPGSQNVVYAEDDFETKRSGDKNSLMPSSKDPIIWKLKCVAGRERQTAFCLIQKYVDLQSLGTKLQIISAFAVEHMKGYIYIEAERECDVTEACKGLCSIYASRMSPVPKNEASHLLSVRNKVSEVSKGTWARVKYGKYKGDLAQVVAVDETRKRATIRLIPRIDLQAMAKKLDGGVTVKQTAVPAPRLISSSELEDFRSHIQFRRDRQTGKVFETIDGLMLKDGYLYKKLSIESLSCSGVVPSADELQKFSTSKKDTSDDLEWLSRLYGEQRKKRFVECDKGTTKELGGTSGTKKRDGFELHDLVFFRRKDFGIIIGVESDNFQILKDDSEGAEVVTVELHEITNGCFDKKFTALDQKMKTISANDTVRVLDGPFKGRQGIVRQIYRGTIFIYDENQLENGGYFCSKAQLCENIKHLNAAHHENIGAGSGPPGFEDSVASPKSPPSPKKSWQAKENIRDFNGHRRGDRDGIYSIGQTLRIRVGPLKGHLCRVIAIYRSDVTVKLDSQLKVITVKCEHLSEAGVKSIRNPDSNSTKTCDEFGTQGHSRDLMEGGGAPAEINGWNSGTRSTEGRNSWPDFSASGVSLDSTFANPFGSVATHDNTKRDGEDDPWGSKATSKKATDSWDKAIVSDGDQKSSWSKATSEVKAVGAKQDEVNNWGKSAGSWDKVASDTGFGGTGSAADSWEKAKLSSRAKAGCSKDAGDSWSTGNEAGAWGKAVEIQDKGNTGISNQENSWSKATESWKAKDGPSGSKPACWSSATAARGKQIGDWGNEAGSWIQPEAERRNQTSSYNKAEGGSRGQSENWGNVNDTSDGEAMCWKKSGFGDQGQTDSGTRPKAFGADGASAWNKGTTTNTEDGGWNRPKGFDCDQEFGWKKGRMSNNESVGNRDQQDSWDRPRTYDGGRGSGGRRGRGGGRGRGNRDQINRGSFSGRGRSAGWNKEDRENLWTGDGASSGNPSSGWNNDRADGWNKAKSYGGDQQPSWGNATHNASGSKNQGAGWSKPKFGEDRGSSWDKGRAAGEEAGGSGDNWNSRKPFGAGESSSWSKNKEERKDGDKDFTGNQPSGWNNERGNWNTSKAFGGNQTSGWGKGSAANEETGGSKDQGFGWKTSKLSSEDQGGKNDAGGNQSSGWGSKASNWNNTKGNQSSGWNQGSKEAAGGSKDQGNRWNRKASDGGTTSGWKSEANDTGGGVGQAASWSSGNAFGGDRSNNWNKGMFGNRDNGGNWRGGKSFGGDSSTGWNKGPPADNESGDVADPSNRSRGFGRGQSSGSSRGGFGNRGRGRRDQSGGWNRGNAHGEDQSFGWNKGTTGNGGGWGNDHAESWNQGGSDKGHGNKGTGFTKEIGNTGTQAGGWNREGSGWNQSNSAKEADGWNNGIGSSKEAGGTSGGWNKEAGSIKEAGGTNDHAGGWNSQGSGWNRGTVSTNEVGSKNRADGWIQSNACDGAPSAGWNRSMGAKQETSESSPQAAAADQWGKAAASSWDKGNDGSSGKGGW